MAADTGIAGLLIEDSSGEKDHPLYDFELDPFQVEACRELEAGNGVLIAAPTGSGKTLVGEFAVHLALEQGRKCFYTTRPPRPIRSYTLEEVRTSARATSPPTSSTSSTSVPNADCTAYSLAGCGAGSDDGPSRRAARRSSPSSGASSS